MQEQFTVTLVLESDDTEEGAISDAVIASFEQFIRKGLALAVTANEHDVILKRVEVPSNPEHLVY